MNIKGFQKLTLLDYKEYLAATIFLGGCNFVCPFCHNKDLVLTPQLIPNLKKDEILKTLQNRVGKLEAVCITGGEPTLCPDLLPLIRDIKAMGYLIKLDTNGYKPETIDMLLEQKALDYIAMDIKNSPQKYPQTTGIEHLDLNKINTSIQLIKHSGCAYEFRTTIVRELHTLDDIVQIANWITGADAYYLQSYKESEHVINPIFTAHTKETLELFRSTAQQYIHNVQIIGL